MADHDEPGSGFDTGPEGRELDPIEPLEVEVEDRKLEMGVHLSFARADRVDKRAHSTCGHTAAGEA